MKNDTKFNRPLLSAMVVTIVLAALLIVCIIQPAAPVSAANGVSDLMQICLNAFPRISDLAGGIRYSEDPKPLITKNTADIVAIGKTWYGEKSFKCAQPVHIQVDRRDVIAFACATRQVKYATPEAHRADIINIVKKSTLGSQDSIANYDKLPGGVIVEYYPTGQRLLTCDIYFWKSPYAYGNIGIMATAHDLDFYDKSSCQPSGAASYAEAKSFCRSEAERLAKLVYSRLPDGEVIIPPPDTSKLPDAALPIAAGATAAVAALGALAAAFAQGISLKDVFFEISGLFSGRIFAANSTPNEITATDAASSDGQFSEAELRNLIASGDATTASDAGSPAQISSSDIFNRDLSEQQSSEDFQSRIEEQPLPTDGQTLNLGNEDWMFKKPESKEAVVVDTSDEVSTADTSDNEMDTESPEDAGSSLSNPAGGINKLKTGLDEDIDYAQKNDLLPEEKIEELNKIKDRLDEAENRVGDDKNKVEGEGKPPVGGPVVDPGQKVRPKVPIPGAGILKALTEEYKPNPKLRPEHQKAINAMKRGIKTGMEVLQEVQNYYTPLDVVEAVGLEGIDQLEKSGKLTHEEAERARENLTDTTSQYSKGGKEGAKAIDTAVDSIAPDNSWENDFKDTPEIRKNIMGQDCTKVDGVWVPIRKE